MITICEATEDEVLKWKSNAEWSNFKKTEDAHCTREAAQQVCDSLLSEYSINDPCPTRGHCTRAWVTETNDDV